LLLVPGTALAKKKHKHKPLSLGPVATASAIALGSSPGQMVSATATCPAGTQAMGGGFSSPLSSIAAILVHDSYMSSPTTWTVNSTDVGGSGGIIAEVYCRTPSRPTPVSDVAATIPIGTSPASATTPATCPGGSQLIGGGFQITQGTSTNFVFPKTNMATSANTWTVSAQSLSSSSQTVTAHAYCLSGIAPPTLLTATNSAAAVQFTNVRATTPTCPVPAKPKKKKGKKKRKKKVAQLLSAGGFSTSSASASNPPNGVIGVSLIDKASGGWVAQVTNATNGVGTLSLSVQGVCV
jgi:hypothetical protein